MEEIMQCLDELLQEVNRFAVVKTSLCAFFPLITSDNETVVKGKVLVILPCIPYLLLFFLTYK